MASTNGVNGKTSHHSDYSMLNETRQTLDFTLKQAGLQLPEEVQRRARNVQFTSNNSGGPYFPIPFKETEAIAALKAIEAAVASAIADIRYGVLQKDKDREIRLNLERASCFAFSTYVATVAGHAKQDPESKKYVKATDLLQAQAITYRRLSANLYETQTPGEYYHIHGSLEATATLNMLGLEGHRPDMTDYLECIRLIESHVKQFTVQELERMNAQHKQAGIMALKWEDFQKTQHGTVMCQQPPWSIEAIEQSSPPVPFPTSSSSVGKPQVLTGIKVLELCRIIAGPAIGRGLAEYGADVIKVTSPNLSDVPFFQVDGNLGKHTTDLDLRNPDDRKIFEALVQEVDVVLDGYRPGSLERLGYGPEQLVQLTKHRDRGIVYVAEDCFGHYGEWATRPGWQQIADCVSGIAWGQGDFMGNGEPVIPPFPMSDYGCGVTGVIAALTGLYKRAQVGGSYFGKCSILQYDVLLLRLGTYSKEILEDLRRTHDDHFFELKHYDSVDEVGRRALKSMRRTHPELFDEAFFQETWSKGFDAPVKFVKPVVEVEGTRNGFSRSSRPNGFDKPTWLGWEVEQEMIEA